MRKEIAAHACALLPMHYENANSARREKRMSTMKAAFAVLSLLAAAAAHAGKPKRPAPPYDPDPGYVYIYCYRGLKYIEYDDKTPVFGVPQYRNGEPVKCGKNEVVVIKIK